MELSGKVAVVTGAGRGIGRDIAERLAAEGCKVVLVSRTQSQLEEVADTIRASGGEAFPVAADIGEVSETRRIMDSVRIEFGTVNVLINNAAILRPTAFLEIDEDEWDATLAVNLKAPYFLSREAMQMMSSHRDGYIINISSTAALQVPAGLASYGTSKMALAALSEAMYQAGKEHGVKVTVIYPGMTDTKMLRDFEPPVDPDKWMNPEDISNAVVFLLTQSKRVAIKEMTPWAAGYDRI